LQASGGFLRPRGARAFGALDGVGQRQRRNKDEWRHERTGIAEREDRLKGRSSTLKEPASWELRKHRPLSNSARDSRPAARALSLTMGLYPDKWNMSSIISINQNIRTWRPGAAVGADIGRSGDRAKVRGRTGASASTTRRPDRPPRAQRSAGR